MSNYVTHRVVVTGPASEVTRFREKVIRPCEEDGQDCFDFETLVPMPDSVRNTGEDTNTRLGIEYLRGWLRFCVLTPEMERSFLVDHQVRKKPVETVDQQGRYAEKESPEALKEGQKRLGGIWNVGCSRYAWSLVNWGTRSPAYDFSWVSQAPDRLDFRFDTAWSMPMPIFDKLASEFPALTIDVACVDEDSEVTGRGVIVGGSNNIMPVKRTAELYEYVHGYPPSKDEEE